VSYGLTGVRPANPPSQFQIPANEMHDANRSKLLSFRRVFSEAAFNSLRCCREGWPAIRSCGAAKDGGARRDRTDDLKLAKLALSQLSYAPGFDGSPVQLENGGPGKT
jgi:hypothetical protein